MNTHEHRQKRMHARLLCLSVSERLTDWTFITQGQRLRYECLYLIQLQHKQVIYFFRFFSFFSFSSSFRERKKKKRVKSFPSIIGTEPTHTPNEKQEPQKQQQPTTKKRWAPHYIHPRHLHSANSNNKMLHNLLQHNAAVSDCKRSGL